jgi:hypothetical protein
MSRAAPFNYVAGYIRFVGDQSVDAATQADEHPFRIVDSPDGGSKKTS